MDKLGNFLSSFGEACRLLSVAEKNGSFIEQICLITNLIDGFLRLSIVMKKQVDKMSNEIDDLYLFQGKKISEKEIFNHALKSQIINKEFFERIKLLYEERNKVVHRFIITNIKTKDLQLIANKFLTVLIEVRNIHEKLIQQQKIKNIGIAINFIENPSISDIINEIKKKHQ